MESNLDCSYHRTKVSGTKTSRIENAVNL